MPSNDGARRDARTLLATWAGLVGLTLASFWLTESSPPSSSAAAWVLGFATLKSLLIANVFMEMRRGPLAWATVMSGFLVGEAGLILVLLS